MSKKVLIVGAGVQGSTVAKMIDNLPGVSEIIVADRDEKAVNELTASMKKGKSLVIDATDKDSIVKAAEGVDTIVNAMPLPVMQPALEAALEARVNYLDFNAPYRSLADDQLEAYGLFVNKYDKAFKDIGKTCLGGSGASPGLVNAVARYTMRFLDKCETIIVLYNEGLRTKRFIPFWWAPTTALSGMNMPGRAVIDGKAYNTKPYSGALYRSWPELGRETVFYEHAHPEPITMAYHSEEFYKGVKNVYFKYGGSGIDFAKPLFDIGLLSNEPEEFGGAKFATFDLIASHLPLAPKFKDEIKAIIDEGIIEENSAAVVESTGTKNGKPILVEAHIKSPGLVEAYERIGFSSEMYQTGMSGAMFTKMLLEEKVRPGFVTSDMFSDEEVDCFFNFTSEYGHGLEIVIREPISEIHEVITL